MPADTSARPILIDQHLCKGFGRLARKGSDLFAQGLQKIRDWRCLDDFTSVIVVAQAKTDD